MKELDCPKCPASPMDQKTVDGVAIDECPRCGGRWYDLGELGRSMKDPYRFQKAAEGGGVIKPRPGSALCPHCAKTMINGGLINEFLRVDLCQGCRGMWLDKNEIGLVGRLLQA
ncbi:MAG: zf-TFIIB domain-containing protein [Elusimicrobiota bacterium]